MQLLSRGIFLARDATMSRGIEIVVGKEDVAETHRMKLIGLLNELLIPVQSRCAAFGNPDGTEAAILWASGHGLDRTHQILARIQKVPTGLGHLLSGDAATVVNPLKLSIQFIFDHVAPDQIATAFDDRIRA